MTAENSPLQLPPLSLYIHIPWCIRKCPYCDFNSHTTELIPEQDYIKALQQDLISELEGGEQRPLQSIFIGGGTPSLFSAESIAQILFFTRQHLDFAENIEITLEVNPGSAEQEKFYGYRRAGVNRLSIGIQSFNETHLQALGRVHNQQEALCAAASARQAGFDNFNLDLMHGLPQQTREQALEDLHQAIALQPSHLSWYQLTIEPNTAFYSAPPQLPADDQLADIQSAGEQRLAASGFEQYEVSAYSQLGSQSRHNLNYWLFGDYIGIGAGAHGKITGHNSGQLQRNWKTRTPKDYINAQGKRLAGSRVLGSDELALEFMMNTLRLSQGFDLALFSQRTGLDNSAIEAPLAKLCADGLLQRSVNQAGSDAVCPTPLGRRFLNDMLAVF